MGGVAVTTTVGLMGFGRIGRNLFRNLFERDDVKIGAIADLASEEAMEYLLRFDTLAGRFPHALSIREGHLHVVGRKVPVLANQEKNAVPPWGALGVDVVLDATARRVPKAELEKHLAAGAARVVLCAPPVDPLDLTVVVGVNDHLLSAAHRIVSSASSTVHAIAPVAKLLHASFGLKKLLFTTVHSYTSHHRLADVPNSEWRRGRAAAENVIPQESRSPQMLEDVMPELAGKVIGNAMSVPVPHGSAVDIVAWHERPVTVAALNDVMRAAAAASPWKGVLDYEDQPIVSSDVAHSRFSSTFDALSTMVMGDRLSKTLAWYDAGWGYAHRVIDVVERFIEIDRAAAGGAR